MSVNRKVMRGRERGLEFNQVFNNIMDIKYFHNSGIALVISSNKIILI